MVLTDNELAMIEQLCYLDGAVAEAAGLSQSGKFNGIHDGDESKSIGEILACFDEEALKTLEGKDFEIKGAYASGKEWADIIRALQGSRMQDLVLGSTMKDADGTMLALCFTEKGNTSDAIVAFKGTSGEIEWRDNVEGFILSDTPKQKEALDYIESLPYDSITVTGHSKGGNKAMYVTITSDKVDRCVAYDGQGFSQEFIDKYWAEIHEKGKNITNYSLSTDYVHALMFPVPNSNQVYCEGYGVENIKQHHSPNSFFVTDINGNLIFDENGNVIVVEIAESESIEMLHRFTTFLLHNASNQDKAVMVDFLGELLAMTLGGGEGGETNPIDFILGNPDALALILAYLVKYMEEYNINAEGIDKLLETLGLDALNEMITLHEFDVFGSHVKLTLNLANILNYIKGQLTDGNDDAILKHLILPALKAFFAGDYEIDISAFWEKINSKIKEIDTSGGCGDAELKSGTIRDFSSCVYDTLINAINRIESMGGASISSWSSYAHEEWYSSLLVGLAIKGINAYFSKLSETNQSCKIKIDTVFDNIKRVDDIISLRIATRCQELQGMSTYIASMADNIVG